MIRISKKKHTIRLIDDQIRSKIDLIDSNDWFQWLIDWLIDLN